MAKKKHNDTIQILFNSVLNDISKDADATLVTRDIPQNIDEDNQSSNIKQRDKSYTELTGAFVYNYKKTHRQKIRLKGVFFWFIMIAFALMIIGSIVVMIIASIKDNLRIEVVAGCVINVITSIIAIPKIIAKYLFPIGEDKDMTEMINKMQNYDTGMREHQFFEQQYNDHISDEQE